MSTPRIRLPARATPGEVIEVRTLIDHPMITGVSSDARRDMLARFEATMNGTRVFACDFGNGASANPTFTFYVRVQETAAFVLTWTHEDGRNFTAEQIVEVA